MLELLRSSFEVTHLVATESFLTNNAKEVNELKVSPQLVSQRQISSISSLKTNQTVLAVAKCLPNSPVKVREGEFGIALDRIRDPGNLGAIIRTADWYGIKKIICSVDCADLYNPKVIHASMGSFTRVLVFYTDLAHFLADGHVVYGAASSGENVHKMEFGNGGLLLIGNEASGISGELEPLVNHWVSIPRFGNAESLNASIATAVICDNFRRITN